MAESLCFGKVKIGGNKCSQIASRALKDVLCCNTGKHKHSRLQIPRNILMYTSFRWLPRYGWFNTAGSIGQPSMKKTLSNSTTCTGGTCGAYALSLNWFFSRLISCALHSTYSMNNSIAELHTVKKLHIFGSIYSQLSVDKYSIHKK